MSTTIVTVVVTSGVGGLVNVCASGCSTAVSAISKDINK